MNLPDVMCKTCGAAEETAVHILIGCNFAKRVWEEITSWLKIPMVNTGRNISELLLEISEMPRSRNVRKAIHAVVIQTLWKTRNDRFFKGKQGVIQTVVEDIKENTFQGMKQRSKFRLISRQEWWDFNVNLQ
ncbi:hypothetical protein Hanom_Chr07g00611811 [Helianthus anomalus]